MTPWSSASPSAEAELPGVCEAAAAILDGGVVIFPTEGPYGLSCSWHCPPALARVVALKHRSPDKGLVVIAACREQLGALADFGGLCHSVRERLADFWPGPVTVLLPARRGTPALLCGRHPTLAARVTAFAPLRRLCELCGGPVVSTSANLSGEAATDRREQLTAALAARVDYIAPLPCGGRGVPSTIIDGRSGAIIRGELP